MAFRPGMRVIMKHGSRSDVGEVDRVDAGKAYVMWDRGSKHKDGWYSKVQITNVTVSRDPDFAADIGRSLKKLGKLFG